MITTVLIDVDDTLLDFNLSAKIAAQKAFLKCGLEFNEEAYQSFLVINNMLWKQVEAKTITREQLHYTRWNLVLEKMNLVGDGRLIEQEFLDGLFWCAEKIDGAEDICKYLSSKYTLCTASNAPHNQQINRLKISGLTAYISHVFTSEASGVSKPDGRFFDECFKVLNNTPKEQVVMIGYSLSSDIVGGKNYGLKTIWVKNSSKASNSDLPTYTVNSLKEIKKIL